MVRDSIGGGGLRAALVLSSATDRHSLDLRTRQAGGEAVSTKHEPTILQTPTEVEMAAIRKAAASADVREVQGEEQRVYRVKLPNAELMKQAVVWLATMAVSAVTTTIVLTTYFERRFGSNETRITVLENAAKDNAQVQRDLALKLDKLNDNIQNLAVRIAEIGGPRKSP